MKVTVADLFNWKKQVVLPTPKGELKLWMRILSVIDEEGRTMHAFAESYGMRAKLDDESSEPYRAYIAPLQYQNRESLITTAVVLQTSTFAQEAASEIIIKDFPEPEDGTLDEQFRVEDERKDNERTLLERRTEHVEARQEEYRKELDFKSTEELVDEVTQLRISSVCMQTYSRASQSFTVWKSCYQDEACTEPSFASLEEVQKLPSHIFNRLIQEYVTLDTIGQVEDAEKN